MKSFIEWLKLSEMPLTHYGHKFSPELDADTEEVFGRYKQQVYIDKDNNQPSHHPIGDKFTKRDRKLLSHPKTAKVLEDKLRKIGINFNILFIEKGDMQRGEKLLRGDPIPSSATNFENKPELMNAVNRYLKENSIDIKNSITFVQDSSSGNLMTPWMVLHRIAHAIFDNQEIESTTKQAYNQFLKILTEYFGAPYSKGKIFGSNNIWAREDFDEKVKYFFNNLKNIFAFKSVAHNNVESDTALEGSVGELMHELIAEYLWNGRVRINAKAPPEKMQQYQNGAKKTEELILNILKNCIGKIISPIS